MKFPFQEEPPAKTLRCPLPVETPQLTGAEFAARYRTARVGGDFFDFVRVSESRVVFLLMDVAGRREEALDIAAVTQQVLRDEAKRRFTAAAFNEAEAVTDLLLELNRAIIRAAGGVRCAPAFLGSYNSAFGMLHYCNAGHTPGLLKDSDGVTELAPTGLPLGLFTHTTNDAQVCVLRPGALLVLVSKGIVESRVGSHDFGLERVIELLHSRSFTSAEAACNAVVQAVWDYVEQPSHFGPKLYIPGLSPKRTQNDTTAVAARHSAHMSGHRSGHKNGYSTIRPRDGTVTFGSAGLRGRASR